MTSRCPPVWRGRSRGAIGILHLSKRVTRNRAAREYSRFGRHRSEGRTSDGRRASARRARHRSVTTDEASPRCDPGLRRTRSRCGSVSAAWRPFLTATMKRKLPLPGLAQGRSKGQSTGLMELEAPCRTGSFSCAPYCRANTSSSPVRRCTNGAAAFGQCRSSPRRPVAG